MTTYNKMKKTLSARPRKWLVTGVGGFIGSNLLETLLQLDQTVVGLDNFSTGHKRNLAEVKSLVSARQWKRFRLVEGDVGDLATCRRVAVGVDLVLHQAALGSVPRSMEDPLECHRSNVTGFLNVLVAAHQAKVKRLVYASSSAVYGDEPSLPKVEARIGKPLSPYAASKAMDEAYAEAFAQAYGFRCIGLRYFNVFGPRQDPEGAYAAVIPKWVAAMLKSETIYINGDGKTSRDFCHIANVVQANLLAAMTEKPSATNQVYNIALGERTTLNQLFKLLQQGLRRQLPGLPVQQPVFRDFRPGDVRHSLADIAKAQRLLGYVPTHRIGPGLELAMEWYRRNVG